MLILSLSFFATAAECPAPVTPSQIESLAEEATLAWAAMDPDGFAELADQLESGVPCLTEPVRPQQAASVHALRGLRAFLDGDAPTARLHLQAAQAADPAFRLSARIAPEGGKLWRLAEDASTSELVPGEALTLLDGGTVWVDGHAAGARSSDRPALVQVGSGDRATWSGLLEPGEAFQPPAAALAALPPSEDSAAARVPDRPNPPRAPQGGRSRALWAATGGAGVVAAGLYGSSAYLRTRYEASPSRPLHGATNGTFIASTGMAAVTGGLLTAALVRNRRTSR